MLMKQILDLEAHGQLVRVREEVDPNLVIAEIQRRAYLVGAPALFFEKVKGTPFPCVSNLFGTSERCRFMFRHTLEAVKQALRLKADPSALLTELRKNYRKPLPYLKLPLLAWNALPKKVGQRTAPVLACQTRISQLPAIKSWPLDGGPFITLPQVFSKEPARASLMNSNLGMYRIQMAGNDYLQDREVGLHYQIHRGIGIHHAQAIEAGHPLKVTIFVGGHPAHSLAAVMPLPEGLSELMFAGMLAGQRFHYCNYDNYIVSADADFCITGTIATGTKPEGPFGDHLGYYSQTHPFPVMRVDSVMHRKDAVWPFTVVGRPPQEDTSFGKLIHEITQPMVPVSLPGLSALHAVDEAGVHPLLLALGSERYVPYGERYPQELLTQANAVLGFNQCSLAKFLMIVAREDNPDLNISHIPEYFNHLLTRVDWTRDLHFQTSTTMDTLDYSGTGLNQGSKLVIAACGKPKRELARSIPNLSLPAPYTELRLILPGILAIQASSFQSHERTEAELVPLCQYLSTRSLEAWPMLVICDDSEFTARTIANFLWVTFTRSNPSHDCHGVGSFTRFKHWGCRGPLLIDARIKPHHAPPLQEDPDVSAAVDALCQQGRSLHKVLG